MVRLLLAATSAAALLSVAGCQSAVQQDPFERTWTTYADSVLNRGIADGSLNELPVNTMPVNQGVHEYSRVDSAGPSGTPTGDSAVVPAGTSPSGGVAEVAASQAATQGGPGDPATLGGQPEPVYNLSLQDAIARALQHNLAIKVEAYNPGIKESIITQQLAAFDPVLFGQSQWNNVDEPTVTSFGSFNTENTFQNSVGIKKLLPSGGTIQATATDLYQNIQSFAASPNPSHEANINLQLTQPLLRGFGDSYNWANIYLAQRDSRIALNVFRRQVITTLQNVEEAYLALEQTKTVVDIQTQLLKDTQETYKQVKDRLNIDASSVNVAQAKAAMESRNADLIRSRADVRNASDKLKVLINDPALDIRGNLLINPTDRPVAEPIALNVAEQIDIALRQRSELQEARLNIEKADITIDVAKNDLLPRFDVTLSTQSTGQDNSFDTAFKNTIDAQKYIDYSAGLKFEIPLGNRQAEAVVKQRNLERRQALTQMLAVAQSVMFDVRNQLRELLTTYQLIQARSSARQAASDQLAALQSRQEIGEKLTPEFLEVRLTAQQTYASAELDELQAMINYNLAIERLEVAKGTLLEYNRVSLAPPPTDPDFGRIRFLGETYGGK